MLPWCFEYLEIFGIEKRLPDSPVGESTSLPIDIIFVKPLNKSRVIIVHYIPSFFFAKLIF
jgi:hypothetical protein